MKALVFDTETTGLPDFSKPADDPAQPRMIQLAAALYDENRGLVSTLRHLVKPGGWTMPGELAAKLGHGLTQERLEAEGGPVAEILEAWNLLHDRADILVAYGVDFDLKIMRGELRRAGFEDRYGDKPKFCVMRACTQLCKMPPTPAMLAAGRKSHKTPKLGEAVEILLKRPLEGAHNAIADCEATAALLFHLMDGGKGPKPPAPAAAPPPPPIDDDAETAFG